jgi:hypothetical protein
MASRAVIPSAGRQGCRMAQLALSILIRGPKQSTNAYSGQYRLYYLATDSNQVVISLPAVFVDIEPNLAFTAFILSSCST